MFNTSTICILISVVVYLVGMLAIGIRYAKNSNSEDFYLGGRKLGPIVTAMSTMPPSSSHGIRGVSACSTPMARLSSHVCPSEQSVVSTIRHSATATRPL